MTILIGVTIRSFLNYKTFCSYGRGSWAETTKQKLQNTCSYEKALKLCDSKNYKTLVVMRFQKNYKTARGL